jgi:beta-lactamase class D
MTNSIKLILLLYTLLFEAQAKTRTPNNIRHHFKSFKGCFLLRNIDTNKTIVFNEKQCRTKWVPCSTFKIPNALFALESGAIKPAQIIKWNGKKGFLKSWDQDHTLRSAIKVSAVPFFQILARKIGKVKMDKFLEKLNYGNKETGKYIDRFWLDGPLRISAFEQLDFIQNLYLLKVPFKKSNTEFVKEILFQKQVSGMKISGKTGSRFVDGKIILGWFVGFVELGDKKYSFVTNIKSSDKAYGATAKDITYKILNDFLLPKK